MEKTAYAETQSSAPEEFRLTFKEKLAYGLGDGAYQLSFSTKFLNMLLTDILGISLKQASILMLLIRIWDGINDPLWGWIVDNSKPGKHGKFRKYLLYIPLPLAMTSVLMYSSYLPNLSQAQKLLWIYITYIIAELFVTMVSVPYGSMIGVISPNLQDKTSLSVFRNIGAGVGLMPPNVILPLIVFKDDESLDPDRLLISIAIMGVLGVLMAWFSFANTKERLPSAAKQQKLDISKTLRGFVRNRAFIVISICAMLLIGTQIYLQTINVYLFKDYFLDPKKSSLLTIVQYASTVLIIPFFSKLAARFGKKELCVGGTLISTLSFAILYFIKTESISTYLVYSFFGGIGLSVFSTASWAMIADTIDQQELLSGQREDGMAFAVCSFARKMGHTAAGSGVNVLLDKIGYEVQDYRKEAVRQSAEVSKSMYSISTLVPTIGFALLFILLSFAYPLSKKKVAELQTKTQERRELSEASTDT